MASIDRQSLAAAGHIAGARSKDFRALVAHLDARRAPQGHSGNTPVWTRRLFGISSDELAALIFYHVLRAYLWSEEHKEAPLLSTIGTALGADLLPQDRDNHDDLPIKIGCQLLEEALLANVVEDERGLDGSHHVVFRDATAARVERLVNDAKPSPHTVRPPPADSIKVRKPHSMRVDRPPIPPRVLAAAQKIQGTAWRVNPDVLTFLEETTHRKNAHKKSVLRDARLFATLDRFYFPVFLDFRGRIYQQGHLLQYTSGSDYARGLLEFADSYFVDKHCEEWLHWHAAQMWGDSNVPFGNGVGWFKRNAKALLKSGSWKKAKHPVQFVAAVFACREAQQTGFVHLPVRLDASCSGLQHLAFLCRDADIAPHVNLWGDYHGDRARSGWLEISRAKDFYQLVAESTPKRRHTGKKCTREECKRVIVPMLYGASSGSSISTLLDLRDVPGVDPDEAELSVAKKDAKVIRRLARTLAPKSFALLRQIDSVAKTYASEVIRWPAPSGFNVIQDYRLEGPSRRLEVPSAGARAGLRLKTYTDLIDSQQQRRSYAANMIHSLDAAFLTELVAGSRIDQWAVAHDAFAVPAYWLGELLNKDLQRTMVQMYKQDRSADLKLSARGPLPREMLGGLRTLG